MRTTGADEAAWWWLTNDRQPAIEATLPSGPIRASVQTRVVVRPVERASLATVQLDGAPLAPHVEGSDAALDVDTARLADGEHVLRIEAVDRSRRRNRGALELRFTSDNTPPRATIDAPPAALRAGQAAAVRLTLSEPADAGAEWEGVPVPLLPVDGQPLGKLALVAVRPTHPGGRATLRLRLQDVAGNAADAGIDVDVQPVAPPRQNLIVPAPLAPLATGPVATAEAAQIVALTSGVRAERLWSGEFRSPLTGVRTTGFGDRRDYADGFVASHSGYDVAAPERTPVPAVARGVVTFGGAFLQRGNTVVIDHGWGVYSLYAHLSETHVSVGQQVTQGQTIGLVGTTGLSTGPHLHWEVRLRGQAVDPDGWLALSRALS